MSSSRGFTLIELLVVIAIIGTLSSIILSALNQARDRGVDAAVRENLTNAQAQATLFYDTNAEQFAKVGQTGFGTDVCSTQAIGTPSKAKGVYTFVLAAAQITGIGTVSFNAIGSDTNVICNSTSGAQSGWAAQVPLRLGGFFCADKEIATTTPVTRITSSNDVICSN